MSHFVAGVIVPGPIANVAAANAVVEGPLEPFCEGNEVEPYEDYLSAEDEADMLDYYRRAALVELLGNNAAVKELSDEDVVTRLEQAGRPFTREDLPGKMEAWRGCEGEIDAEGRLLAWSTYNPDSHWDWYEVGGRWSGMLYGADWLPVKDLLAKIEANADARSKYVVEKAAQRERIYAFLRQRAAEAGEPEPDEATLRQNADGVEWALGMGGVRGATPEQEAELRVANMTEDGLKAAVGVSFFAMITLGGEWLEKGRMGMFGTSYDNQSTGDWFESQTAVLQAAVEADPDAVVVVVDCHI